MAQGSLPVTEQLCSQVLSLPIFPELSDLQQQQVVTTLEKVLIQPTEIHPGTEQADQLAA